MVLSWEDMKTLKARRQRRARAERKTFLTVECSRCGYVWLPRVAHPKTCPRCKQYIESREIMNLKDITIKEEQKTL